MRKIAVFTGTRAEYGLLYWLMMAIKHDKDLQLQVIVSGAHLSPQYGDTWREIVADGFEIDEKVEMLLSSDSTNGVVKSMGLALIGFADALSRLKPNLIVILGDRVEALAMAEAALIMKIPIVHLHGGELTLGAYDDAVRHAITKMASIHCVAAEPYRQRIIQMGEQPSNVFNVGALGLEHVIKTERYTLEELGQLLQIPLRQPYFLVTYHPVTLANECAKKTCEALFQVFDEYPEYQVLLTYPNADNGSFDIIQAFETYCQHSKQAYLVKSLGHRKYLSAVAHAAVVIGNSSSGIIEVPAFGIPTVNIGLRQRGRLAAQSVLHCSEDDSSIKAAVDKALSPFFRELSRHTQNPYGNGRVSERILPLIKHGEFSIMKQFYAMELEDANG